jgi:site-specific recombinase XerD
VPRVSKLQLPFDQWPAEDRTRWQAAFKADDIFDDDSRGSHLSAATREALRVNYAQYLKFLSEIHSDLLALLPKERIDREIAAEYVNWLRRGQSESTISVSLHHLRLAYRLVCPDEDWSWLLTITKRLAAAAPRKARRYHLVTSDQLYMVGIELMDGAAAEADTAKKVSKTLSLQYRDGLIIAFLSLIPLRRRTLVALRIDKHLVKTRGRWSLDVPEADTKTEDALDYTISETISSRIDEYLERFRARIPCAKTHLGFWASNKGCPMTDDAIYAVVFNRTKKALGFGVNLHRFRHAAGSLWSIHDPANVRGVKDLLGHSSFNTTETHYIMSQSRMAGRKLAHALDAKRK